MVMRNQAWVGARAHRAILHRTCATGALALGMLALPQVAYAQDECGSAATGTVTCTSTGNPYVGGIRYTAPPTDLTINVDPDVVINTTADEREGFDVSSSSSVTINAGTNAPITTAGYYASGVRVETGGNAVVNTTNITTTGELAHGVVAIAAGSIAASITSVATTGKDSSGVVLNSVGAGTVDLVLNGDPNSWDVFAEGESADGIYATSVSGNIAIRGSGASGVSGNVLALGVGSSGVVAQSDSGNIAIDLGRVWTVYADAINASSTDGSVDVKIRALNSDGNGVVATAGNSANVTHTGAEGVYIATGGDNHIAVRAETRDGPASASLGSVYTLGAASTAVDVRSTNGTANVTAADVTTQGENASGVLVRGAAGASATVGSVTTLGNFVLAVDVRSSDGDASVTYRDIAASGEASVGVYVYGENDVSINGSGAVVTTGANSDGILATANTGSVAMTFSDGATVDSARIGISAFASGDVDITGSVDVIARAANRDGVVANSSSGDTSVNIGTARTLGASARGVYARSATGNASATVEGVSTEGDFASGLVVNGETSASATQSGFSIETLGEGAIGARVEAGNGPASANIESVSTAGDSSVGIVVSSANGTAAATIGTAATLGEGAFAVSVTGTDAIATVGTATTQGGFSGAVLVQGTNSAAAAVGSVTTSGLLSHAVQAISLSGNASVTYGDLTTSGSSSYGVYVTGANAASVTGSGAIVATGAQSGGIYAVASAGPLTMTFAEGASIDSRGNAIAAQAGGDIVINGPIDLLVRDSLVSGVFASSSSGDVSVNIGTAQTLGASAYGVFAGSGMGDANATVEGISTEGDDAYGLVVQAAGSASATQSGTSIQTLGDNAIGVQVLADGLADANIQRVSTAGANARAISVSSSAGVATVTAGEVVTQGDGSTGIRVRGDAGASATFGTVQTSGLGALGVDVASSGGVASVAYNGGVSTSGAQSHAIYIVGVNGATLAGTGSVVTTGLAAEGIYVSGGSGPVTMRFEDGATVQSSAAAISADSASDISVEGPVGVLTREFDATGVQLLSTGGNIVLDIGQVKTLGDQAEAVLVTALSGVASATVQGVATEGEYAHGMVVRGLGSASVTQSGSSVATLGTGAVAVRVVSGNGPASASIAAASTAGADANAIEVRSSSQAATATVGTVSTLRDNSIGLFVTGGTDANAAVGTATTGGDNSTAVRVSGSASSSATVGSIATSGDYSDAVSVSGNAGTASVAYTGSLTTAGAQSYGVVAAAGQDVAVTGNGTIATVGEFSSGILAISNAGPVAISLGSAATIQTQGYGANGIYASGAEAVMIAAIGAVATSGEASAGVFGISSGAPVLVTVGAVTTSGADALAIGARGSSASVVANGAVVRSGSAGAMSPAAAIDVHGTAGSASVDVASVTASGAGVSAVTISGDTGAAATIRAGGVVTGDVDGILINSAAGSSIANAGTLNTGTGYAIRATGGAAAITNSGTINGRVLLTAGNDSIANSGIFNASQASDFGGGNDSFTNAGTYDSTAITDLGAGDDSFVNLDVFLANNGGGLSFGAGSDSFGNSGTLRVLPGTAAPATIAFTGLESFANSGAIDLRNGHAGDVFTLGGASFTGSAASTLLLDVQLGGAASAADRLVVGAATGSTQIALNAPTSGSVLLNPGLILVQGGAGSSPGAFTVAGGTRDFGLVSYSMTYNAADFAYRLVGAPSLASFRTVKLTEGARNLWHKSSDAWSGHMTELRDAAWSAQPASAGSGLWMQMSGSSNTRRNAAQSFTAFGVTTIADLAYQQDAFGGQVGYDFGGGKPEGGAVFGVTGGYLTSTQGFANSSDRVKYDAVNLGGYAGFTSGAFFINALAKYDFYWADTRIGGAANRRDLKGRGYGGQAEAGLRLGGERFFAEPAVSIAYVRTDLDALELPGFAFNLGEQDGLRGKAGLRIGSSFDLGGTRGVFYGSGMAVREFEGRDSVTLVSGGETLVFRNQRPGTYGQGTLGINITTPGGVTGFIEAHGDFGGDYRGGGGRAGLRLRF